MSKGTVLLVDDEIQILNLARRTLETEGYLCETFEDSEDAFERAKENDLDLIIIDVNMPHLSAITFTRRLRAGGFSVPIIWASGDISDDTRASARRLANVRTLQKPFEIEGLLNLVQKSIEESSISSQIMNVLESQNALRETMLEIGESMMTPDKVRSLVEEVAEPLIQARVEDVAFMTFVRKFMESKLFWPLVIMIGGGIAGNSAAIATGLWKGTASIEVLEKSTNDKIQEIKTEQRAIRRDVSIIKRYVVPEPGSSNIPKK